MKHLFKHAAAFLNRAPELWKENVELIELNHRFLWFLILRFGVAAAMLVLGFTKNIFIPHLHIRVESFFAVGGILTLLNILYWCHYEWFAARREFPLSARSVVANVHVQIISDFLILGWLVYECGGIESPLVYFFLFHNTLSCLFFRKIISFTYTMISIAIIFLIYILPAVGLIPHRHFIEPAYSPIVQISHSFAIYYLAGIFFVYIAAWYLSSTMTQSLKLRERELQEKVQEMIDLVREKNRYLLVTTHELKAPFAAIQSYVNVALEGYAGGLSEKMKEILFRIRARCDMLANMITRMIQLANITSLKERPDDVTKSRMDISGIIMRILPKFNETAAAKNVSFDTSKLSKGLFVEANGEQLEILFSNVISNAVIYSFHDTKITIASGEKDKFAVISVNDTGIAVKKEHLEKVFLEHFRAEKAVEVNPNGTGLGLTIAKQIMDIHGGRIWMESSEESGTTVFTEFPKAHE